MFCPKCGVKIRHSSATTSTATTSAVQSSESSCSTSSAIRPSRVPSFNEFKSKKESERRSYFNSGKGQDKKKRKVEEEMVSISVGVMKDVDTIKRGETLPLKFPSTATTKLIIDVAKKKHSAFNQRFNENEYYRLVFKDGGEATYIPGTNNEEFTLKRYKEESGFGYARITLYLLPTPRSSSSGETSVKEECPNKIDVHEHYVSSSSEDDFVQPRSSDRKQTKTNFTSSNAKTSTNTNALLVDCPTCWLKFSIEKIEEHADICAQTVEHFEEPLLLSMPGSQGKLLVVPYINYVL